MAAYHLRKTPTPGDSPEPCSVPPGGAAERAVPSSTSKAPSPRGQGSPGSAVARPLVRTRISERDPKSRSLQVTQADPDPSSEIGKTRALPNRLRSVPTAVQRRSRARPRDVVPAHVHHCSLARLADGFQPDWFVYSWPVGAPDVARRTPYACQSWRCKECAPHESHVMFARIGEAIAPLAADGWCFLVLTIDREGTYSGKPWKNAEEAFRDLSRMSRNFMSRVRRWQKKQGWRATGNEWIATVEAHRTGWPHVNLMFWSPALAAELRREKAEREKRGGAHLDHVLMKGDLLEHATGAGWGVYSTAEAARNADSVASYMVKLAGEAGATAGELAKLSQLPTMAHERFRRLRSGKGFLPPRRKNPAYTGTLVRRSWDHDGTPTVLPLHASPPECRETVVRCCYSEETRMVREAAHGKGSAFVGDVVLVARPPPTGPP